METRKAAKTTQHPSLPTEVASAVNLLAHPVAGMAAMSALGMGLASHAFGLWAGTLAGSVEVARHLLGGQPDANVPAETSPKRQQPATVTSLEEVKRAVVARRERVERLAKAAGAAMPIPATLAATPVSAPVAATPDDLKAISGIGPKLEQVLNQLGISTYTQIATLTAADIARLDDQLGFNGRIERDGWIAQAARLAAQAKAK